MDDATEEPETTQPLDSPPADIPPAAAQATQVPSAAANGTDDSASSDSTVSTTFKPSLTAVSRGVLVRIWRWLGEQSAPVQTLIAILALALAAGTVVWGAVASRDVPEDHSAQLVSSDSSGSPANDNSGRPSVDASGRYVAYVSTATNLDRRASRGQNNIFRKDLKTGRSVLVSVPITRDESNGDSQFPMICTDGRYVAFASTATNLVPGIPAQTSSTDPVHRIFVRDVVANETYLVSRHQDGTPADGDSRNPHFSGDCSKVSFESTDDHLVPEDGNGLQDVFVAPIETGHAEAVNVGDDGRTSATRTGGLSDLSPDGSLAAYSSWEVRDVNGTATLVDPQVFVRDLTSKRSLSISGQIAPMPAGVHGFGWPDFSPDDRYLIFRSMAGDATSDRGNRVYVWDLVQNRSVITGPDGRSPSGWGDACTQGVNDGTRFSPQIVRRDQKYLVLFPVAHGSTCSLVMRDLAGNDEKLDLGYPNQEVFEPALNDDGTILAWTLDGKPKLVYVCDVDACSTD